MRTGDERYLPPRDKGPVRRFIRDFVDSRFSFVELMVPLLVVTMILGYSGNAYLAGVGQHDPARHAAAGGRRTSWCCGSGCAASSPGASRTSRSRARPTTP